MVDIALEAIRLSIHPLPEETSLTETISPAPSALGKLLCNKRSIRRFSGETISQENLGEVIG